MADSLAISLHATPKIDANKESLPYLISRINDQRGSFREITEESVTAEINAAKEELLDTLDEDAAEDSQDVKPRHEQLADARDEMFAKVQQALWECSSGLTMISLILAGHNQQVGRSQQPLNYASQAALSSIDPFVKERLPTNALAVDILQSPPKLEQEVQKAQLVGDGWKQQSIEAVADRLSEAATRLEKELQAETRYWDQMLKIKDQGWSVIRLPRERHSLGVRYGFAEAHADFRDRGMAALRRDEDGNLTLDRGIQFTGDRRLRVRVFQQGKVISCSRQARSTIQDPEEAIEEDSIEDEILQARDSLFDEELHAELHREARHLTGQGVTCIGDVIQLLLEANKSIQIDLVDFDEEATVVCEDSTISTGIAIVLRVLLSHAHHQNIQRRCQPPPPLTQGKMPRPVYQILKPVIEHLQNRSNLQSCLDFANTLAKTLHTAGLPFRLEESTSTPFNIPEDLKAIVKADAAATESLVRSMIYPLQPSITLHPPSSQSTIKLGLTTNLFKPDFGTTYQITVNSFIPTSQTATLPETMQLTTFSDAQEQIRHALTVDLVDYIDTESSGWTIVDPHTGTLSREYETSEGTLESMSIRVSVQAQGLILQWAQRSEDDDDVRTGAKSWQPLAREEGGMEDYKSLLDIVRQLAIN